MKIKTVLGWSLFILSLGLVYYGLLSSMYFQELERWDSPQTAITMVVIAVLGSLTGFWLGIKLTHRLAQAAMHAALHMPPNVPKRPSS